MSSSQAVYIKSGDQPRLFPFGIAAGAPAAPTFPFPTSVTTNQASRPIYKESVFSTFQGIIRGTGAGLAATIAIQCSNDDNTGRGFTVAAKNAPGFAVSTASGSAVITSSGNEFTVALLGALVFAPGVPIGTTIITFTNAGSMTMSANATATQTSIQMDLFDTLWNTTPLGTITLASTGQSCDGFTTTAPWRYVRALLTGVAGGGLTGVSVNMGV